MFDFHGLSATIIIMHSEGDVTQNDLQWRFLAQHSIATLFQHCYTVFSQNHCCESSHVTYIYLKIVWSSTIRQSTVWQVHLMIFSYPRFWRIPLVCFRVLSDGEPDYKWCVGDWNNPLTFSRKNNPSGSLAFVLQTTSLHEPCDFVNGIKVGKF